MLEARLVSGVFSESPEPFICGPHLGSPIFYFLNFDAILCIRSPFLFIRLAGYLFPIPFPILNQSERKGFPSQNRDFPIFVHIAQKTRSKFV